MMTKRGSAIFLALFLCLLVFLMAACGGADHYIGAQAAKEIALLDAGLSETELANVAVRLERGDAGTVYAVRFQSDSTDYYYGVDVNDGSIVSFSQQEVEPVMAVKETEPTLPLDANEALLLACRDLGVDTSEVNNPSVLADRKGGRLYYLLEFDLADRHYVYDLDAESGELLEKREEPLTKAGTCLDAELILELPSRAMAELGLAAGELCAFSVGKTIYQGALAYELELKTAEMEYELRFDPETDAFTLISQDRRES